MNGNDTLPGLSMTPRMGRLDHHKHAITIENAPPPPQWGPVLRGRVRGKHYFLAVGRTSDGAPARQGYEMHTFCFCMK